MKLVLARTAAVLGALAGTVLLAVPAEASRTAIDGNGQGVTMICDAGASTPCTTPTLLSSYGAPPLVADFGFGPFSSVFIYNNGIISIGTPIAPGADFTSLASIGGNVFTAAYSPSMTLSNFTIQGPGASQYDNKGDPVLRVYYDTKFDGQFQQMEFSIYDLGSGKYELSLEHGNFNGDPLAFPADAYLGYSFNGSTMGASGTALQSMVLNNADFNYFFTAGTGTTTPPVTAAVPEAATWATILVGFAGVGAGLRRTRARRARARMPARMSVGRIAAA